MDLLKKGSLFKQQKNDPVFLAGQEKFRLSLLKNLARAIKEAQLLHATREGTGAIGDCRATQRLCARFEDVLRHGLKVGWFGQSTSFWPVVLNISRKQAIAFINSLQYAQSDSGRCRAWIRLAVNECSLESYISVLYQDASLLGQYYDSYSFLRNAEMMSALQQLLVGLSQLTFNITVDTASLEFGAAPEAVQPALRIQSLQKTQRNKGRTQRSPQPAEEVRGSLEDIDDWLSSGDEGNQSAEGSSDGKMKSENSDSKPKLPFDQQIEDVLNHDEVPDALSLGAPDISDHRTPDILNQGTPDISHHGTPDISNYGTPDVSNHGTPDHELPGVLTGDQYLGLSPADSALGEGSSLLVSDEEEEGEGGEEVEGGMKKGEEEVQPDQLDGDQLEGDQLKGDQLEGDQPEGDQLEGDQLEGDQLEGDQLKGDQLEGDQPEGDQLEGDQLEGDQLEGDQLEGDQLEGDQLEGGFTLEENVERSPSPVISSPSVGTPETSHPPILCDSTTNLPTPFYGTTTSPTHQASDPFSGEVPEATTYQPAANPFDMFDELDSSYREVTPKPEDGQEDLGVTSKLPNQFDSYSGSPFMPEDGPLEDGLLEESLSDFPLETASYSSSLDLSCLLEATLEPTSLPRGSPSYLQVQEDHFPPELSISDHHIIIQRLKSDLASCSDESNCDRLRRKIVQLQLRLQRMKESEVTESHEDICGHQFVQQPPQSRVLLGMTCEGCGRRVTGLMRLWYQCKACRYPCHKSCLAGVTRMCTGGKEEGSYVVEICPEKGLTQQHFRCACCNRAFNKQPTEARLCDYSGLYYCPACHQRDLAIIPARVLRNWDFKPRKVCCQCSDLLGLYFSRPLLRVQEVNPLLYTYVQDLVTVEALRQDILYMKQYFVQCRTALESHLLQKLDHFPHFKEDSCLFSLQDLVVLHTGRLLPELQDIHKTFAQHIRQDCPVCSGKGYFCEVCASEEVLFPFDRHVSICQHCSTVYHKACFSEQSSCPKCYRLRGSGHKV